MDEVDSSNIVSKESESVPIPEKVDNPEQPMETETEHENGHNSEDKTEAEMMPEEEGNSADKFDQVMAEKPVQEEEEDSENVVPESKESEEPSEEKSEEKTPEEKEEEVSAEKSEKEENSEETEEKSADAAEKSAETSEEKSAADDDDEKSASVEEDKKANAETDEKSADTDGKAADIDGKSADIDGKSADIDGKSADTDGKSADIDGKSADIDEKSADTDGKSADTDGKSADTDEKSAEEKKDPDSFDQMLSGEEKSEDKKEDGEKKENADPLLDNNEPMTKIATDDINMIEEDSKVPSDEVYFETVPAEEKEYFADNTPSVDTVANKLHCTSCWKQVAPIIGPFTGASRHPHLGVTVCKPCRQFYGDGDWKRDVDGCDEFCRWCAQGGDILLCDKCPNAFCKRCLQRNLGRKSLADITGAEEWACLMCDAKPIYRHKATYYSVYKNQAEITERKNKMASEAKEKQKKRKSDLTKKEGEKMMKSPRNFLEENISEAFKTLEVYQKSLETERARCIRTVKDGMDVDTASSITRKLRKLYAVTQKNMDLLDRALVEAYVENFPTESTRIHMGRVAPNDPPSPTKSGKKKKVVIKPKSRAASAKNKKAAAKKKVVVKKKKKKGTKVIRLNGSPVYDDYVTPSLTGSKKKKKRARADESDVECIDVSESDEDFYRPTKKKARPGPASAKSRPGPASSKKKPGPASSKRPGPKSRTVYY